MLKSYKAATAEGLPVHALAKNSLRAKGLAGTGRTSRRRHVIVGGDLCAAYYSGEVPRGHSCRIEARWLGSRSARPKWWIPACAARRRYLVRQRGPADGRPAGIASLRQRDAISSVR